MRQSAIRLCVATALAFAFAASAEAADWSVEGHKKRSKDGMWGGYAVGTMVHTKMVSTMNIATMPEPKVSETEIKKTLKEITPTELVFKMETRLAGGAWNTSEARFPRDAATAKWETKELGTEAVKVGDKSYDCKKVQVTTQAAGEDQVSTYWEHAEHGVLKSRHDASGSTMTVTKLSVPKTISGTTYDCREFTASGGMGGSKTTMVMCPDVPGWMVSSSSSWEGGGNSGTTSTETVAITKPAPKKE